MIIYIMTFRIKAKLIVTILFFAIWWILSIIYPPLVVPSISLVFTKIIEILVNVQMIQIIGVTVLRLLIALSIRTLGGFIMGMLCGISRITKEFFKPIIGLLQVIPPVS